nr:MAG TPA: hypothetical protein [Caudoviricetes sp.]
MRLTHLRITHTFTPSAGSTTHQDGESLFNIDGIVPPKCGNQRVVGFGIGWMRRLIRAEVDRCCRRLAGVTVSCRRSAPAIQSPKPIIGGQHDNSYLPG